MKFEQKFSGSSGNLYTLESSTGQRLMIDPGVTWTKILKALNYDLKGIVGCVGSHLHQDHLKAAKDVMRAGINLYASVETLESIGESNHRAKVLKVGEWQTIGDFEVMSFDVNHDCPGAVGFIIKSGDESMLFMTDSSHLDYTFETKFDIVVLECSYDREYLEKRVREGTINKAVATRLLTSHMEEKETLRTLQNFINLEKCHEIHLIHCSADNLNKERIRKEFEDELFIKVITI